MVVLTEMSITDCQMIEEIIARGSDALMDGIVCSQLKTLELGCLPSLSSFCSGNYAFGFPSLEELIMRQCPKMEIFTTGGLSTPMLQGIQSAEGEYLGHWEGNLNAIVQQLFTEKVFPSLEDLERSSINIQRIRHKKFLARAASCAQYLTCLTIEGCHNLNCLFSSSMMESFVQLKILNIENCENIEKVILIEELAKELMSQKLFRKLEFLLLKYLPKLTRFCHGSYLEFPLLRIVRIESCLTLDTFVSDAEGNNSEIACPTLFNEKRRFTCSKFAESAIAEDKERWDGNLKHHHGTNFQSNVFAFTFIMMLCLQNVQNSIAEGVSVVLLCFRINGALLCSTTNLVKAAIFLSHYPPMYLNSSLDVDLLKDLFYDYCSTYILNVPCHFLCFSVYYGVDDSFGSLAPHIVQLLLRSYNAQIPLMVFMAIVSLLLASFFGYHANRCLTKTAMNETFKWQDYLSWQKKWSEARASVAALKASITRMSSDGKPSETKCKSFFRRSPLEDTEGVVKNNVYDNGFFHNFFEVVCPVSTRASFLQTKTKFG
ncbi:uncharacterized protein LOC111280650 [Durio zibethinus]|uniref:Uncharacterized protein LOC111280650 n=1 Tax=Durio zibethinus TaxID=66656 RepID=A0A6P5X7H2_DURZI|nr:uncharacterized protein LOC111280650 [Durio zibethinus]